jgi:hypothetical protein
VEMMEIKTTKELRGLGVTAAFGNHLASFQNDYNLGMFEVLMLLQSYQIYLMDMIAFGANQNQKEEE